MNNEHTDAEGVQAEATSMGDMESYKNSFKHIKTGDYVQGIVERKDDEGMWVNLGGKTDGFVPANEIADPGTNAEDIKVGDMIDVVVLQKKGGQEGEYILSKRRADRELSWKRIIEVFESKEIITATCTEVVKGGIIVDVGVRGFVPASHVDLRPVRELGDFVGEELKLRIIELDKTKRKVVLSRKVVLEEDKEIMRAKVLANIKEGDIIKGTVVRLTNFGAFVDLGGMDGLIHISELSTRRVNHPQDVVKVGEEVDVLVLKIEPDKDKIALSLRRAKPDPWQKAEELFPVGSKVEGRVTKLAKRYAFIEVMEGIDGLIPISEISNEKISAPSDVLAKDQVVMVKVLEVKGKDRRMLLSMREPKEPKPFREPKAKKDQAVEYSSDSSVTTIGDLLKAKHQSIKDIAE